MRDQNTLEGSVEAREAAIGQLEGALGFQFANRALLEDALRHSSYAHEVSLRDKTPVGDNERLEFLGDSVLGVVVAHALFEAKPEWQEGELSRALHALVEGRSLTRLARRFDLGPLVRLGRTEQQSGGVDKPSILANAMEAVIGAIFLDAGLEAATTFVKLAFGDALGADAPRARRDPKTELQEGVMAIKGEFPIYRLVSDNQIEGDENRFTVEVLVADQPLARGIGRTKRAAEQLAAKQALATWQAPETAATK